MTKAIFYKEWIKLRGVVISMAAIFILLGIYLVMSTESKLRIAGSAHLWAMVSQKDINMLALLKYFPIVAGLVIGMFQFIPEMNKRSLKLTLHLPIAERKTIVTMMLFCVSILLAVFVATCLIIFPLLSSSFPWVVLNAWLAAASPWFLAGLSTYFLCVWVCIEPAWKRRIANGVIAVTLISSFIVSAGCFGYIYMTPTLIAITLICALFPFHSVIRFKEGVQD